MRLLLHCLIFIFSSLVLISQFSPPVLAAGRGFWSVRFPDNGTPHLVDERGQPVRLAGTNWGFQTYNNLPLNQLDNSTQYNNKTRGNYKKILDSIKAFGFNSVRFVYRHDHLWGIPNDEYAVDRPGKKARNKCIYHTRINIDPDLEGLTCFEVMDKVIHYAGSIGLRIVLDFHVYQTKYTSESMWIHDWVALARYYKNNPNVIGADLMNEPHHSSSNWGICGEGKSSWKVPAERAANAILNVHPKWLIFVEAILGCNFVDTVRSAPLNIKKENLVYSFHEYPWNLRGQRLSEEYFDNMFGNIVKEGLGAVHIGEFNTRRNETAWLTDLLNYMKKYNISGNHWAWRYHNPINSDQSWYTEGIIEDDYITIRSAHCCEHLFAKTGWFMPLDSNSPIPSPTPRFTPTPTRRAGPTSIPTKTPTVIPTPSPTPVPLKGDANGDGQVNISDFTIFKTNYILGGAVDAFDESKGNFNGDKKVDGNDYAIWYSNYSQ